MHKEDKIVTMENDYNFRVSMFKKVFGTEEGKILLEYLEKLYNPSVPKFEPNVDYYMLGKYRVVQEMRALVNKQLKKGKENE